jgi:hypothetical protein
MSFAIQDAEACQKTGEPSSLQAANRQNAVSKEALSCLPTRDIGELRQQWRGLYKTQPPPNLSRELLVRAVAYRMQELVLGRLRSEPRRQLLRIAQQFKQTGEATIRARPQLKPGTRLMREWHFPRVGTLLPPPSYSLSEDKHRR